MLDYLIYEAIPNSTIPTPETQTSWVFIDDRSEYLIYGDGEGQGGTPGWSADVQGFPSKDGFNITDATFNSTVMGPTTGLSTVSFNFTGTPCLFDLRPRHQGIDYNV